jgi:TetR/AcrR family transcriptional regulator, transcriptional repressor for nem operon
MATPSPPQLSTRDRLIMAAVELFWAKGYEATGMAELLQRANANSGSFYHFFRNKNELLLAVLDWYLKGLYPVVVDPVWAKESDPIERIFALLERYRERILFTDCTFGCPIGRLAMEIDPENRRAHEKIAANFEGWAGAVRTCLEMAAARLPRGTDPIKLSRFVLTVMEGGVMQSRAHRSVQPFDEAVEVLRDYVNRLLSSGKTKSKTKGAKRMRKTSVRKRKQ